ncbi:MAG: hypothetical protein NTW49_02375 [Bacteroidia bacterium]|nr:hypothetical protein [Bacteroidia bacterium]
MKKNYNYLIINSTILFVIASIAEMTLHECGHYLAGILVHVKENILYHNYVSNNTDELSISKIIFIKAAGPAVSLFIGVFFHIICFFQRKKNLLFLFNLYMSAFGYIGVFGYLIIAPVFPYGDTGYICNALHFSTWLTVTIAVVGVILLFFMMRDLVKYFVDLATEEIATTKELRFPFIRSLIMYPLFFGIIITTLLNIPIPTFASLIAPVCSPFAIMWTYGYALNAKYPKRILNQDIININSFNYRLLIFLAIIVIVNRLLVGGLSYN